MKKDKSQIEERIQEIKSTAQQDYAEERMMREQKIEELQQQRQTLDATKKTTQHDMTQHLAAVNKYNEDKYRLR